MIATVRSGPELDLRLVILEERVCNFPVFGV